MDEIKALRKLLEETAVELRELAEEQETRVAELDALREEVARGKQEVVEIQAMHEQMEQEWSWAMDELYARCRDEGRPIRLPTAEELRPAIDALSKSIEDGLVEAFNRARVRLGIPTLDTNPPPARRHHPAPPFSAGPPSAGPSSAGLRTDGGPWGAPAPAPQPVGRVEADERPDVGRPSVLGDLGPLPNAHQGAADGAGGEDVHMDSSHIPARDGLNPSESP